MNGLEHFVRPAGTVAPPLSRGLRILVVEDHADTRRGLELLLVTLDHQVILASDMKTALKALDCQGSFDLLLSDLGLPDGSGWELLGTLARMGRRPAQAVAMSGFCSVSDKERSRAAGFRAHLIKPFSVEELEAVLDAVAAEKLAAAA